jgi:hypothetical protein
MAHAERRQSEALNAEYAEGRGGPESDGEAASHLARGHIWKAGIDGTARWSVEEGPR